jgi:hypothetical protein
LLSGSCLGYNFDIQPALSLGPSPRGRGGWIVAE